MQELQTELRKATILRENVRLVKELGETFYHRIWQSKAGNICGQFWLEGSDKIPCEKQFARVRPEGQLLGVPTWVLVWWMANGNKEKPQTVI